MPEQSHKNRALQDHSDGCPVHLLHCMCDQLPAHVSTLTTFMEQISICLAACKNTRRERHATQAHQTRRGAKHHFAHSRLHHMESQVWESTEARQAWPRPVSGHQGCLWPRLPGGPHPYEALYTGRAGQGGEEKQLLALTRKCRPGQ